MQKKSHRAHNLSVATASEPCLNLRIDVKPFSEAPDWDTAPPTPATPATSVANTIQTQATAAAEPAAMPTSIGAAGQKYVQTMQTRLPGLILNQVQIRRPRTVRGIQAIK